MASRGRRSIAHCGAVRAMLCLILVWVPTGCRSVYRLRCTSNPTPAGVLAGEEFLGETECTVKIPKDSEWIHDGQIELTFCLPDGTEKTRIVDLREREPSHPLAEVVAWPFLIGGLGLLAIGQDQDEDDDSSSGHDDDDGDELAWLGLGALGIGAGAYLLLGGDFENLEPYHIHVDFSESAHAE